MGRDYPFEIEEEEKVSMAFKVTMKRSLTINYSKQEDKFKTKLKKKKSTRSIKEKSSYNQPEDIFKSEKKKKRKMRN